MREKLFIFILSCAIIIGPAYMTCDHFDFSHSPDSKSYMKMAQGDFDVNITHRYRIIVPGLAYAIHKPISSLYKILWPERTDMNEKGLMLSFLMINTLIISLCGFFIFRICQSYGSSYVSSLIGLLSFLTSCWSIYAAGLPLIDSLYILTIALTIWGIKIQDKAALIAAIFLGPFAKESFVFIAPLIVLFGRDTLRLKYQIPLFAASGLLVFVFRYLLDYRLGVPADANLNNAFNHFNNVGYTLRRVFSFRGAGEIFRVWGLFTFVLLLGLLGKKEARSVWISKMGAFEVCFLAIIIVHMLISGDAGRMLYLASPVFAAAIALILDLHPYFQRTRNLLSEN